MINKSTVLITGASTGIGATYANRFAARGDNLVLVARNEERMGAVADKLRQQYGVEVDIMVADLTKSSDLQRIEQILLASENIDIFINNAGTAIPGAFVSQDTESITRLISLNISAVTVLANAAAKRFSELGRGAIINLASVVGLAPEMRSTVYGATKSYVLFLSQGMNAELAGSGVYVQAVLPAATRTEIWDHTGVDINAIPGVMEVDDLVDAALAGFDMKETVTIPPLPEAEQWASFEAARLAMLPNFSQSKPAARYQTGKTA